MAEMGWFGDRRVGLIDGEIIETSPQAHGHFVSVGRVGRWLSDAFGDGFWIRAKGPLRLAPDSEPEPDVAVVPGSDNDYLDHPTTALLVVEIGASSLSFDSSKKAAIYAAAGIADYWIVNLQDACVEVYRRPVADAEAVFGLRYSEIRRYAPGNTVSPLARPEALLAVADLLP